VIGIARSGGEGGIRTLDTGVSPYNGLAIAHKLAMHNVLKRLQSESGVLIRNSTLSIGAKCSLFCSPILIDQAGRLESILEDQRGAVGSS